MKTLTPPPLFVSNAVRQYHSQHTEKPKNSVRINAECSGGIRTRARLTEKHTVNLHVLSVGKLSPLMEKRAESIALVPAMLRQGVRRYNLMDEYLEKVLAYRFAISLAAHMLSEGIISEEEYHKIDTIMAKKHGIFPGTIFR